MAVGFAGSAGVTSELPQLARTAKHTEARIVATMVWILEDMIISA
jgi:hypothetical protein